MQWTSESLKNPNRDDNIDIPPYADSYLSIILILISSSAVSVENFKFVEKDSAVESSNSIPGLEFW